MSDGTKLLLKHKTVKRDSAPIFLSACLNWRRSAADCLTAQIRLKSIRETQEGYPVLIGGDTRQQVLAHLLERRDGLTIDEIASTVGVSRSAIKQHLFGLERDGQVVRGHSRKTGGRPEHIYVITDDGIGTFPKQYSWFSRVLLESLRSRVGDSELDRFMYELGVDTSAQAIPRLMGKTRLERVVEIVKIMNETGFVARTVDPAPGETLPRIECQNCVYHDLSKDYPSVCRFDIGFISGLMGSDVEHQECMQRGGSVCRFRLRPLA